jgi:hypothetical protein
MLLRAVCELRYDNAFLIFDRTGHIVHELKKSFTEVRPVSTSPAQTSFQSNEGGFVLELTQSRFTAEKPDPKLEGFAAHCKTYFDLVTDSLGIKIFTRVGMRLIFRKILDDRELARTALTAVKLFSLKPQKRFGASDLTDEVLVRWEGAEMGAFFRLKAETTKVDVYLPPELEADSSQLHKSINGLVLDVDYYTVAPVEREQWDPTAWIPQNARIIRKEADDLLRG